MLPMYLKRFSRRLVSFLCVIVYITINNDIANIAGNNVKFSKFKNQFLLLSSVELKIFPGKRYWKHGKLIKSKIWDRNYFRKYIWSYFDVKKRNYKRLKMAFFYLLFFRKLTDEVETIFWKKEVKRSKLFESKFSHRKHFWKWFWSYLELN